MGSVAVVTGLRLGLRFYVGVGVEVRVEDSSRLNLRAVVTFAFDAGVGEMEGKIVI